MRVAIPLLAVGLAGCVLGGGPIIGVRLDHGGGGVFGAESGGGIAIAQVNVGGTNIARSGYVRFDASWDAAAIDGSYNGIWATLGGRLGGGSTLDGEHGVAAFGPSVSEILATQKCDTEPVLVTYVELRYERGWQLVLNPRVELHGQLGCGGH